MDCRTNVPHASDTNVDATRDTTRAALNRLSVTMTVEVSGACGEIVAYSSTIECLPK